MKIYVSHATAFDYQNELYTPLKTYFGEHEIFLPHEVNDQVIDTKEILKNSDLILAEVSYPSTGQGIELGWANDANVPVVCVYHEDTKPSSALAIVTNKFISYSSGDELVEKLQTAI